MTRGRCGSLVHIRMNFAFTTPRRFSRRTGRSKNEDQNKTDCSTHAGACRCVCCSCAATIAYGSRHRFDVRRYAHGQGQDSCPVHADVCEGRHEVRTGRGEKGLYLGRTRIGTRQARWPESHGQGNSEGRHAFRQRSHCVEIGISFDLTLESVPAFRLFSRRTAHAFGTIGASNGRKHRHVAALRATWTLASAPAHGGKLPRVFSDLSAQSGTDSTSFADCFFA